MAGPPGLSWSLFEICFIALLRTGYYLAAFVVVVVVLW